MSNNGKPIFVLKFAPKRHCNLGQPLWPNEWSVPILAARLRRPWSPRAVSTKLCLRMREPARTKLLRKGAAGAFNPSSRAIPGFWRRVTRNIWRITTLHNCMPKSTKLILRYYSLTFIWVDPTLATRTHEHGKHRPRVRIARSVGQGGVAR